MAAILSRPQSVKIVNPLAAGGALMAPENLLWAVVVTLFGVKKPNQYGLAA